MRIIVIVFATVLVAETVAAQESIQDRILSQQLKFIDTTPLSDPVIMRLDVELEQLTEEADKQPRASRARWLASAMSPQARLYRRFGMSDLNGFARLMLGEAKYAHVKLHRDAFAKRDLSREIRIAYRKVSRAFGKAHSKAPIYKVAYGYQKQTNAAMEGRDRRTGRHIVILNRSALAEHDDWETAVIHETWHTFQGVIGKTLKERAIHEGVATYLTTVINPELTDHKALFWDKKKWETANSNRKAILESFLIARDSTDPKVINGFTQLNATIPELPKAPDRCGYYVGLLACRAWHQAHPQLKPADLIAVSADDVLRELLAPPKSE